MVQIDVEMPRKCMDCPFIMVNVHCPITGLSVAEDIIHNRLNNVCPLKEVKGANTRT